MSILTYLKYGGLLFTAIFTFLSLYDFRDNITVKITAWGRWMVFFLILSALASVGAIYRENEISALEKTESELVTKRQLDSLTKMLLQVNRSLHPVDHLSLGVSLVLPMDTNAFSGYLGRLNNSSMQVMKRTKASPYGDNSRKYRGIDLQVEKGAVTSLRFNYTHDLMPHKTLAEQYVYNLFHSSFIHVNFYHDFMPGDFLDGHLKPDLEATFPILPKNKQSGIHIDPITFHPSDRRLYVYTLADEKSFDREINDDLRSVIDLKGCTVVIYVCADDFFNMPPISTSGGVNQIKAGAFNLTYNGNTYYVPDRFNEYISDGQGFTYLVINLKNALAGE